MKPVTGYAGKYGRFQKTKLDAALDLVEGRGPGEWRSLLSAEKLCADKEKERDAFREAAIWIADQLRKPKKTKSEKRSKAPR